MLAACNLAACPSKAKTTLINALLSKGPNKIGYVMNEGSPAFIHLRSSYEKSYCRDEMKAEPRMLYAQKFQNGTVGLDEAIAAGQVTQFVRGGIPYCAARSIVIGKEAGRDTVEQLKRECFFERQRERDRSRARQRQREVWRIHA